MALKDYNGDYFKYIDDLINGDKVASKDGYLNIENFNGVSSDSLSMDDFWEELLKYLATEEDQEACNGKGGIIREGDFKEHLKETVAEYINNRADLDNFSLNDIYATNDEKLNAIFSYINNYIEQLPDGESHWNESLAALVNYYQDNYGNGIKQEDEDIKLNDDGTIKDSHGLISGTFRIDDQINADAGNYFGFTGLLPDYSNSSDPNVRTDEGTLDQSKTYVRPWFNIDGDNYINVRSKDRIERVLNSNRNLQFTRFRENEQDYVKESGSGLSILERYLRLIMPMYERTVEIEDLNRNFWVIGQVLSGLCSYLFDDESPFVKMFQGILDELIQLWENVAFLWAEFAPYQVKKHYTDIKTLFVPVWNDEIMPYVKFDNFGNYNQDDVMFTHSSTSSSIIEKNRDKLNMIWEKISSILDEYSESNLLIFPELRYGNYMKNYYYRADYPGFFSYNRNTDTLERVPYDICGIDLSETSHAENISKIVIRGDDRQDCFIDYGNNYIFNPDISLEDIEVAIKGCPIYAVRTIFSCEARMDEDDINYTITKLEYDFKDLCKLLYQGKDDNCSYFKTNGYTFTSNQQINQLSLFGYYDDDNTPLIPANTVIPIAQGYYLGECCTWALNYIEGGSESGGGGGEEDFNDADTPAKDFSFLYPCFDISMDGKWPNVDTDFNPPNLEYFIEYNIFCDERFWLIYYEEMQIQSFGVEYYFMIILSYLIPAYADATSKEQIIAAYDNLDHDYGDELLSQFSNYSYFINNSQYYLEYENYSLVVAWLKNFLSEQVLSIYQDNYSKTANSTIRNYLLELYTCFQSESVLYTLLEEYLLSEKFNGFPQYQELEPLIEQLYDFFRKSGDPIYNLFHNYPADNFTYAYQVWCDRIKKIFTVETGDVDINYYFFTDEKGQPTDNGYSGFYNMILRLNCAYFNVIPIIKEKEVQEIKNVQAYFENVGIYLDYFTQQLTSGGQFVSRYSMLSVQWAVNHQSEYTDIYSMVNTYAGNLAYIDFGNIPIYEPDNLTKVAKNMGNIFQEALTDYELQIMSPIEIPEEREVIE